MVAMVTDQVYFSGLELKKKQKTFVQTPDVWLALALAGCCRSVLTGVLLGVLVLDAGTEPPGSFVRTGDIMGGAG